MTDAVNDVSGKTISFTPLFLALLSLLSISCPTATAEPLRLDDSFTVSFSRSGWEDMAFMNDIIEQQDGKILLAGWYDTINGAPIYNISRLNSDGTLDPAFDVGSGVENEIKKFGVQSDGRIILAGYFSEVNGVWVTPNLARLNNNGSLDTSFTATADSPVWDMDISNDKIIIGGQFTAVNGTAREQVARLNADGTLDAGFNPGAGVTSTTPDGWYSHRVWTVATIPSTDIFGADSSKVLVGGEFTSFNHYGYKKLVRLQSTGAVDTSFSIGDGFNLPVLSLAVQPDGNYLVGGSFTSFNNSANFGIVRLLSTGAVDSSFNCAVTGDDYPSVRSIAIQDDGRIVIGGNFTTVNGIARTNVARLNPDGSLDMEFDPGSGPDGMVRTVLSTRQNQVIIGGSFQSFNSNDQIQVLARFNSDPSMAGGTANPHTVFAGGKDDWKQINLPRPTVNSGTLDLLAEGTLYYLSTVGPPIYLRLTYNSNLHNPAAGIFGKRWSFLYESSILRQSSQQIILRKGTGEQETYSSLISLDSAAPGNPVTLTPTKGTFNELTCYGDYWEYREKATRFTYRFTGTASPQPAYLTAISDRNNNSLALTTDPATGRIQQIIDPAGRQINFTYTGSSCSRITVPDGRKIEFLYDGLGQLVQIKDMIGYLGKYSYDNGYITKTDLGDLGSVGGGHEMSFTYSDKTWGSGKYVSATQSSLGKTLIEPINDSLNQVRWTNPSGQVTTVSTENGKTTGVADSTGALRSLRYVEGLLSSYTSATGKNTTFAYDSRGNTTKVTDALGNATTYVYDSRDNLIQRRDAQGNSSFFDYDANDKLLRVRYPNGTALNFAYSAKGQLTTYTNARGKITRYAYDSYGNLITITAPDGGVVTYSYWSNDQYSRCYKITDSLGKQKSYTYDKNNRITAVSYGSSIPYDAQVRYSYDALDLLSATDELGNRTRVVRDGNSQIIQSVDPLNQTTKFEYDSNGNLTKQTNPLGQSIQTSYNAANRPVLTIDPMNRALLRSFDADGNLLTIRDANNHTTRFTYDANNRLKTIRNPLDQTITKTYDSLGRETETENSRGTKVIRTYDALGNLLSKSYGASKQVDYSYDASNNLLTSNHTTLGTTSYSYNDSGRVATITWPDTKSVSFLYNSEGHVSSMTYPDGLTVSYSYDDFCRRKLPAEFRHGPRDDVSPHAEKRNQVTAMSWPGGSLSMQYDPAGTLLQENRSNTTVSSYRYDANRNITGIDHKRGTVEFITIANSYDAAERRLSSLNSQSLNPPLPTSTESISYDDANQVLSFGSTGYSNDADGNVTGISGTFSASYGAENRPVTTNINGVTRTYFFDGEGHPYRIVRNGVTHHYHFDHRGRLLFISDLAGTLASRFVYRGNRLVAQQAQNNQWYFYHFDTNGNTIALTNSAGTVVAQYAYSPHGQYATLGTPPYNPFTFVGQYGVLEQENDIYLMTNRLYLAESGRFLQRDPLGLTGGVNLYVYAGNNPVGYIDPQGTFELDPDDIDDTPQNSEGTADLDTNELPHHTDEGIDPATVDALNESIAAAAGTVDNVLENYGKVPGLPQGNFINAARAARDGNYSKATWETCKGAIGCIPGPGTAINISIDTTELLLTSAKTTSNKRVAGGYQPPKKTFKAKNGRSYPRYSGMHQELAGPAR